MGWADARCKYPHGLSAHGNHARSFYLSTNLSIAIDGYNNVIRPVVNDGIFVINGIRNLFNGTPWNEIGSLPSNSTILAGLNLLDVPAARQLMMNRINLAGNLQNNLFSALQTELNNLGYPQQTRNIAVSNGSECAITQGFGPYADLLTFNGRANTRFLGDVLGTIGLPVIGILLNKSQFFLGVLPGRNEFFFDFNCKAQPASGTAQIYRGKISYRKKILYLINANTTITDRTKNAFAGLLLLDGSPGGMYDTEINLNGGDFKNWLIKYSITASNIPHFNFVPTPSALGIGNGVTALSIGDYNARYIGALPPPPPLNSPFANFTTAFGQALISNGNSNNNEDHIQISPRNGNFVAAELDRLRLNPAGNPPQTNCNVFCTNGAIAGNTNICNPQTLTAPFGNGVTYNWSVDNTSLVTLAPSGNTVLVTRNGTANGTAIISVAISDACGNTTLTIPITVGTQLSSINVQYSRNSNAFQTINFNQNPSATVFTQTGNFSVNAFTALAGTNSWDWVVSGHPPGSGYGWSNFTKSGPNCSFKLTGTNAPTIPLWVTLTNTQNGCTSSNSKMVVFVASIPGGTMGSIVVSPNPASDNINVTFIDAADSTAARSVNNKTASGLRSFPSKARTIVSLFDFNAATLVRQWIRNEVTGKQYNFNIAGLKKGFYVLQVDRDDETRTTKIIIE